MLLRNNKKIIPARISSRLQCFIFVETENELNHGQRAVTKKCCVRFDSLVCWPSVVNFRKWHGVFTSKKYITTHLSYDILHRI